jgi:hypothetical protein
MTTITVEVEGARPLHPGVAIVRLDGQIIAKLRTSESIQLTVSQTVETRTAVKP